jgi:hypothetical protein
LKNVCFIPTGDFEKSISMPRRGIPRSLGDYGDQKTTYPQSEIWAESQSNPNKEKSFLFWPRSLPSPKGRKYCNVISQNTYFRILKTHLALLLKILKMAQPCNKNTAVLSRWQKEDPAAEASYFGRPLWGRHQPEGQVGHILLRFYEHNQKFL